MTAIRFRTADGLTLEGELRLPEHAPWGSAVVCHPDPQAGGSKDHPLLWAIRAELARRGLAVLAFNFRGVMGSEGEHTRGRDEPLDVAAAVERVRREADGPTAVAGWSFGASVALRAATGDQRVGALALVGIPLGTWAEAFPPFPDEAALRSLPATLLVAGTEDPFCPHEELAALAARIPRGEVLRIPGADHFFARREEEPAAAVGAFVERVLAGGGQS